MDHIWPDVIRSLNNNTTLLDYLSSLALLRIKLDLCNNQALLIISRICKKKKEIY